MHRKSNNHRKSKNVSRKKSRHTKKTHVKYGGGLRAEFQKILKKEKIKPSIYDSTHANFYRKKLKKARVLYIEIARHREIIFK